MRTNSPDLHELFLRDVWMCSFLETDLKTPIGRIRKFSEENLRELIARTPTRFDLPGKQALDSAFGNGFGGVFLDLTAAQYQKLKV